VSVILTIEFPGVQVDKWSEAAQQQVERFKRIAEDGRSQGAIHHLFAATDDGTIVVVDEWDNDENWQRFFANQEEIKSFMSEYFPDAGQPIVRSYRVLDTPDRF
jgi:hypothetical protein